MTGKRNTDHDQDEDGNVRALLREAGSRPMPSANVMASVRQAVHAEWQRSVARRARRLQVMKYAAAACVIAGLIGLVGIQLAQLKREPVATIARMDGALETTLSGDEWQPASMNAPLAEGSRVRTGATARAALTIADVSLRMDADTRIALVSANRISLERGAIYVDSGIDRTTARTRGALVIDTPAGAVKHLGTQYQVRLSPEATSVSVREGRVQIDHPAGTLQVTPGERIVLGKDGDVQRTHVTDPDAVWGWAVAIAPAFDIERQPLSRFLDWAARELGKTLEYESDDVRVRAETLVLRGSVQDLSPEQALAAVLATTPFQQQQTASIIRIRL